ncbi:MAG: carboxypeptidase-like regulatory domain-containing protein [Bacteroides uniformis]
MVSLALEDRTVDEVLTELEQGTEFVFFYNNKQVDVNRRVSVQVNNKTIFKVLNDMFKGTNIGYKVLDRNIILYDKAVGAEEVQTTMQAITVKGTVADATGEPIIGASILVKGTSNGVITDIDGNFTLSNVAPTATLLVSYVGYKTQEIRVDGKTSFNIVLAEDAEVLDEVVVVGYGVQKKQSLTGAVTAITSETIQTTKSENLINNIQGKMPGLMIRQKTGEPGTFDNMISIRGGGEPLIVIDGVTREYEEFAQLNSEDIENISILKDASAAIYGMNSANGVIIVYYQAGAPEKDTCFLLRFVSVLSMLPVWEEASGRLAHSVLMENEMSRNGKKAEVYSQDILDKYKNGVEGYRDWDWIDMYMNKQAFATNHTRSVSWW